MKTEAEANLMIYQMIIFFTITYLVHKISQFSEKLWVETPLKLDALCPDALPSENVNCSNFKCCRQRKRPLLESG